VITTRSGPPVEVFEFTEAGAAIAFLGEALQALSIEEPLASIALLTPDAEQSELYHQGLVEAEVPRVHRVLNQDFRFAPGIEITEFDQIKGLEFDYVVLTDVSEAHFSGDPISRRRLHVGATRAVHQLWLLSIGRPSAPVREAIIRTTRRAAGI